MERQKGGKLIRIHMYSVHICSLRIYVHTDTHTYKYIYILIYLERHRHQERKMETIVRESKPVELEGVVKSRFVVGRGVQRF